ncbi:MAG TPA: MFS transporter [Pirellulaceae bacterium]|nr:MFS transporter [Pirellulaceae bacterium]
MNPPDNSHAAEDAFTLPQQPTPVRFGVLALLAMAGGSAYLTRHCIAVANTTIQEELDFNNAQMGLVLGAFSLGYLLCQIPGGWLGSRFGTRVSLPLLSVLWSFFSIWTAAVSSLSQMIASRFAFGLAQAGLVPNAAQVVKDWFPVGRRGIVSSIITMSMSVGAALTMAITAVLLEDFHWRWVFRLYSLVGIAWAVAFYAYFRTFPRQHPWVNQAERELIEGDIPERADHVPTQTIKPAHPDDNDRLRVGTMLCSGNLWAVCLQSFFRAAGYNLFVTFFPAFLEFAYGISRQDAGAFTKWPLLGVIAGGLLGGLLVDATLRWTGNKWLSRSGVAVGAMAATAAIVLASSWTTSAGSLVAVISIGAMASGIAMPCGWVGTIDVGGRHTAVIVGIMNMAGCLSGVIVTPLLGQLIDYIQQSDGNWNLVIYLHVAFYLLAAVSWIFVNPNKQVTASATAGRSSQNP